MKGQFWNAALVFYAKVCLGSISHERERTGGRNSLYFHLFAAAFAGHIATEYKQPSRR